MGNSSSSVVQEDYFIVDDNGSKPFIVIDEKNFEYFIKVKNPKKISAIFPEHLSFELFRLDLDGLIVVVFQNLDIEEFAKAHHPFVIKSIVNGNTNATVYSSSDPSPSMKILKPIAFRNRIQTLNAMSGIKFSAGGDGGGENIIIGAKSILNLYENLFMLDFDSKFPSLDEEEKILDDNYNENYFTSILYKQCIKSKGFVPLSPYTVHSLMVSYQITKEEMINDILKEICDNEINDDYDLAVVKYFSKRIFNFNIPDTIQTKISLANMEYNKIIETFKTTINESSKISEQTKSQIIKLSLERISSSSSAI